MELVKPSWLRIRPEASTNFNPIKQALRSRNLVTVCEEAHCPNMAECWHQAKTATFMVMGDTCTRGCKFCAVKKSSRGQPLDPLEPESIAAAAAEMGLDYVVITSVDRDDLPDQGAITSRPASLPARPMAFWSRCSRRISEETPIASR